jgi:hypothetical protein
LAFIEAHGARRSAGLSRQFGYVHGAQARRWSRCNVKSLRIRATRRATMRTSCPPARPVASRSRPAQFVTGSSM